MSFLSKSILDEDILTYSTTENIKLVVVGENGVGKTCMLIRYANNSFPDDYIPTVFDNYGATSLWENRHISLGLWDTAGYDDYDRLRPLSYPETNIFLLLFDLTNRLSFEKARDKYNEELNYHCPGVPKILVGTKCDLLDFVSEERKISKLEIAKMCKEINAFSYFEISAKEGINIKELFHDAISVVIYGDKLSKRKKFLFFKTKKKEDSSQPCKVDWDERIREIEKEKEEAIKKYKKEIKQNISKSRKEYKKYYRKLSHDVIIHILSEVLLIDITQFYEFNPKLNFLREELGISTKGSHLQHFGYFKNQKNNKERRIFQFFYCFKIQSKKFNQFLPKMKKFYFLDKKKGENLEIAFQNYFSNKIQYHSIKGERNNVSKLLKPTFRNTKNMKFEKIDYLETKINANTGNIHTNTFLFHAERQLKALKSLKIINFDKSLNKIKHLLKFPNLEMLELHAFVSTKFKFLDLPNLKVLRIKGKSIPKNENNSILDHVSNDQFQNMMKIKTLEIVNFEDINLMDVKDMENIFDLENLKELTLMRCSMISYEFLNFKKFGSNQGENLEKVKIEISSQQPSKTKKIPQSFINLLKKNQIELSLAQ